VLHRIGMAILLVEQNVPLTLEVSERVTFGISLVLQNYALWQFGPVARKIPSRSAPSSRARPVAVPRSGMTGMVLTYSVNSSEKP
jgi:hypothetical protein